MNLVSQYVLRVGAYMIFSLMLEGLIPQGSSKKIVKLMISLVFLYVLIQPVLEWIHLEMPLSELTTAEISWNEMEMSQKVDYEEQAWTMMEKGYEQILMAQGLPKELQEEYKIQEVKVDDTVEVTLARMSLIGSLNDRSLQLGQIGIADEEKDKVISSLSEYWGIPTDQLEMKLR